MNLLDSTVWRSQIYSIGWRPGDGGDYPVMEPATGAELGRLGSASVGDVRNAAERAQRAQREWAALTYDRRAEVLRRAGQLFLDHESEIADWLVRESGSVAMFAHGQVRMAAEECWNAAALAAEPYGRLLRTAQQRLSMSRRVPVGVVGVIAPFNGPILLAVRALAPALALGNAVLVKPDPRTAVTGGVVFARIFEEAELPEGLLHVLPGGSDVGAAVVEAPQTKVIAFTGSTRGGYAVAALAARHLKRTHLELGGNSAMIVLGDADVKAAAALGALGTFTHGGQICMAVGRHLVHESIADDYVQALSEHADQLRVGNPTDSSVHVGPLIDQEQRDRVQHLVTSSVDLGAKLVAGGTYDGLFYRPTVLGDVPRSAPAYQEEVFGPVASVVSFRDDEEAVRLAADTPFGLSLGILTRDVLKGLNLAERIPTGMIHINDQTINDEPIAPFGGIGDSGSGSRQGGNEANLDAFTELQWVTVRGEIHVPM
jgi:benzaldehyde dehydrogenase (NAD)